MDINIRARYIKDVNGIVEVEVETMAGQNIGKRLTFKNKHDLTIQFDNGSIMLDDIDMIIGVIPNEYFCYRDEDVVATFIMDNTEIDVDLREPVNGINGRAFIRKRTI